MHVRRIPHKDQVQEDFQEQKSQPYKLLSSDMAKIKKHKGQLSQDFKMKDLGSEDHILGMSIIRDKTKVTLRISQEKYIGKVLEKFNIKDVEATSVGSVIYRYDVYNARYSSCSIYVELKDLLEQPFPEQSDSLFPSVLYAHRR
ncbi:retrovirus-related pol polyprotein from transposon TNT 1-94 [Tanacetum coccineum]